MHGTLRDMLIGVPGAEDVVMGLDANLRQGQNSSGAFLQEHALGDRSPLVPACSAAPAVVRHDGRRVAKDGLASEQDDDMMSDHVRDEFLDHGE